MVTPYNYRMDVIDPASGFLSGYSAGLQGREREQAMDLNAAEEARNAEMHPLRMQGLELGNRQTQLGLEQGQFNLSTARDAGARRQSFMADFGAIAAKGPGMTFDDVSGLIAAYPEMSASIMATWDAMDDERRKPMARILAQSVVALQGGNTDLAARLVEDYAVAAENSGDDEGAALARAGLEVMKMDPNAALATISGALAVADPELARDAMGINSRRTVSKTDSFQNGTSVTYFNDGSRQVVDPTGKEVTGDEAVRVIQTANDYETQVQGARAGARGYEGESGKNVATIETGGTAAAAVKAGENAQAAGMAAFERIGGIESNIARLNEVKRLVDEGARTGVIASRFPTFNQATIELRNMQSQLGLDVIGSVTFGALSEGELNLALSTALPTTLEGDALKAWVDRKIEAQQKLATYLTEQAKFLMKPGNTIEGWLSRVEQGAMGTPAATAPAPAPAATPPAGDFSILDSLLNGGG